MVSTENTLVRDTGSHVLSEKKQLAIIIIIIASLRGGVPMNSTFKNLARASVIDCEKERWAEAAEAFTNDQSLTPLINTGFFSSEINMICETLQSTKTQDTLLAVKDFLQIVCANNPGFGRWR